METKKRYVQVGIGGRARFFYEPIAEKYFDACELLGFCDINRSRMEYAVKVLKEKYNYPAPKLYGIDEFEKMIEEQKPDVVIVTSIDRTHHKYIIKAMEKAMRWAGVEVKLNSNVEKILSQDGVVSSVIVDGKEYQFERLPRKEGARTHDSNRVKKRRTLSS